MKIIDSNKLQRLTEALNEKLLEDINDEVTRAKAAEQSLDGEIDGVRDMFGGKSLKYITQAEYDRLSDVEKNNSNIVWNITDAPEVEDVILDMIGNRTIVYLTQAEYNALTEVQKQDDSIAYFITDNNDIAEIKDMLNGYSLWVGSSEEYNALTSFDDSTIYFEVGTDTITEITPNSGTGRLSLTKDKYQEVNLTDNSSIVFPATNTITEIHLFITGTAGKTFSFSNCKMKEGSSTSTSITSGAVYEVVALFNMSNWLVEVKKFS